MLARILYFILLSLIARIVFRAVAEWSGAGGSASGARRVGGPRGTNVLNKGRMVRDPVCGLNLPEDRAVTELIGGERFYFCSARCRNAFAEDRK